MDSDGVASESSAFVHQALIYGSEAEFMDVAMPFVKGGLSAGQPTLVAVQDRHVENLRGGLGGEPDGLTLHPVEDWYETSARTRQKFASWAAEQTERGGRARLMGEPPWSVGHPAQVRDWARHESVINLAFAGQPVTFICPYDSRALPADVLGHARCTHPEIVSGSGVAASASYEDPHRFCQGLEAGAGTAGIEPDVLLDFGLDDLPAVRRAIGSFAIDAGLSGSRTEEVVLAVNEITTNAVIHGRQPATVRAWRGEGEIVVEVADAGDGIQNALAGQLMPSSASRGGRGLWLTRLLCDAVEVRNGTGCTVTMHVATPSPGGVATAA
jgi:anti-sigma regulatory factor (Ser/Thr protein kinase)